MNGPGLAQIGGLPVAPPHFNENMPLRDQPPVINTVAGAAELQEWFDRAVWAAQAANPAAYAPHLRRVPFPGVSARPILFQFARGDQQAPNPNNTAILRAGDLADRAMLFRNDLLFAENPAVQKNPHGFMLGIGNPVPLRVAIARDVQRQIALFFVTDGATVIYPEPRRLFEWPISPPLPEGLNYIP
jgi:hypothetical protein